MSISTISSKFIPDILDKWVLYKKGDYSIWISGNNTEEKFNYLVEKLVSTKNINKNYIKEVIKNIDDHFGIVIISDKWTLAAVDCARTIPIFWKKIDNAIIFSPQARKIASIYKSKVDKNQLLAFQMSGYTIDEGTLWQDIKNINPGYFIFFQGSNEFYMEKYFFYQPWITNTKSYDALKEELKVKIKNLLKNLIIKAKGRTIAIPLSAGLDSRLVVSGLKELNFHNVKCYSYGLKNNFESKASKLLQKNLVINGLLLKLIRKRQRSITSLVNIENLLIILWMDVQLLQFKGYML